MKKLVASLLTVAGTVSLGLVAAPSVASADPVAPPAGAIVVGTAGPDCASPAYSTIQSAITAASSGATIYVCPGTYNESLTIDKPLTILGAGNGLNAATRPTGSESVITGSAGIKYTTGATTGTLSGFTLNGYTGTTAEIVAYGVGSGWTFTDNVIDVSRGGLYLNTNNVVDPAPTTISGNSFIQSQPSAAANNDFGQGMQIWQASSANVTVSDNTFTNLSGPGAAVNANGPGTCHTSPTATGYSDNITVTHNTMVEDGQAFVDSTGKTGHNDENFVVIFCSTNSHITDNTVTLTMPNDPNGETPIYLGGSDYNTTVQGNTLTGNGASAATGISLNSNFYVPGTGDVITGNWVSGFNNGIGVTGSNFGSGFQPPTDFTISGNAVADSVSNGIAVTAGADLPTVFPSGGSIYGNVATGSGTNDCSDPSTGGYTAGTANTWWSNSGATSSPAGLCSTSVVKAPQILSDNVATASVGAPFSFTVTTLGYPTVKPVLKGKLPAGLTYTNLGNGSGVISGTPTVAKSAQLKVNAKSSAGQATQVLTLEFSAAPVITSKATAKAKAGKSFKIKVRATGTPAPALSVSGQSWATITDNGNGRGLITGTAPAKGTYTLDLTAASSSGVATQAITLTVK